MSVPTVCSPLIRPMPAAPTRLRSRSLFLTRAAPSASRGVRILRQAIMAVYSGSWTRGWWPDRLTARLNGGHQKEWLLFAALWPVIIISEFFPNGGNACSQNTPNTFQIVIYESTGIVEIYVQQKGLSGRHQWWQGYYGYPGLDAHPRRGCTGKTIPSGLRPTPPTVLHRPETFRGSVVVMCCSWMER